MGSSVTPDIAKFLSLFALQQRGAVNIGRSSLRGQDTVIHARFPVYAGNGLATLAGPYTNDVR